MTSRVVDLRSRVLGQLCALAVVAWSVPGHAGEGHVVHVGETIELIFDDGAWALDKAASRKAHLVSVQKAGSSQRYVVRGLKTGQVELVFRSGQKTFHAHIDVLN